MLGLAESFWCKQVFVHVLLVCAAGLDDQAQTLHWT